MKKININQIISFAIIILAILVAINIFKTQSKKIAGITQVRNKQITKNEKLLVVQHLQKKVQSFKEYFKPRERREIINSITSIAATTGIQINSLKPLDQPMSDFKRDKEIYDKLFFRLNMTVKDYHHLGEFISKLENNPTMFIVENINFRTSSRSLFQKADAVQVDLTISELFFK